MAGPRRRRRGPRLAPIRVEIRFTELEHQALCQAASRPGRGVSIARYVAEAALAAAGVTAPPGPRRRSPSRLVLAEVADAVSAVNRVGNNLNQLAREKNITGQQPAAAPAQIERALAALERLAALADTVAGTDADTAAEPL